MWRKELDYVTVRVTQPKTRPLVPDVPEGIPPPTSQEYLEQYLSYLLCDVVQPRETYTYGSYLEEQFLEGIRKYKQEGFDTNQICFTVGDKKSILLEDPPCLRIVDTRVRYGKLHFMVYFRSWDLWGGFPSNLGGLQLMKEMMAKELGAEDGELIASSKGLHLYDNTWDYARKIVYG